MRRAAKKGNLQLKNLFVNFAFYVANGSIPNCLRI